jgi:parvulin-like peptidyl-prolyl isomerase
MSETRSASRHPSGHLLILPITLAAACFAAACGSTPEAPAAAVSADTWAVVNGQQIMREDVDKAYRRSRDTSQVLSEEETLAAKLDVLSNLIVQEILLGKARELKLEVAQSDLDTAYANASKNIAADAFQQELARRSLTEADMREGLRRELLAQKVIAQEVGSKVVVSDQEISDYFNANRSRFNIAEESYHLAQIVVTPGQDGQVTNGTGDDAATPQAAVAKVQMLMERLKAGASFQELAVGYSEDPETTPRGGDLGFVPISRLKQAPPQLRDAVLNKERGSVNVANVNGVFTLVLVVAHEQAGQRDLSMPGVREGISETLRARKDQLFRAAYLTVARGDAEVDNHMARRLVESKGQMPGLPLTSPGAK